MVVVLLALEARVDAKPGADARIDVTLLARLVEKIGRLAAQKEQLHAAVVIEQPRAALYAQRRHGKQHVARQAERVGGGVDVGYMRGCHNSKDC